MTLGFVLVGLVSSTAGCPNTFDALASTDGGSDAAHDPSDGSTDAAFVDAGRDAAFVDAGPDACASGVRWIDPVPQMRPLARERLVLIASTSGFELFFHDSADETPTLLRVPTSGAAAAPIGAAWASPTSLLYAASDELGTPSFAAWEASRVVWARAPSGEPWDTFDGEHVPELRSVADVAFTSRSVLIESYEVGGSSPSRVVTEITASGAGPLALMDPVLGNTFEQPQLAVARDEVVWSAMLSAWDRPRSVQFGTADAIYTSPNGCVVDSFDFVPGPGTYVATTQDCSSRSSGGLDVPSSDVELSIRESPHGLVSFDWAIVGRRADGTSSRLARAGDQLAVAYRGMDAALHVVVYTRDLALLTASTVPGADLASAEDLGGPFDIAGHDDGTFAIAWTHAAAGSAAAGAIQRFRACE